MNRAIPRIGVLATAAVGTLALTVGSVGAVTPRQVGSPDVTVEFQVRGDLTSIEARLADFNCVDRVQPNPVELRGNATTRVDVKSFNSPICLKNEAIWDLRTRPRSPQDKPETMVIRLRYGARPTTVEFLQASKDLRWHADIRGRTQVLIDITGK